MKTQSLKQWKQQKIKEAAEAYKTDIEAIRILPRNSKRSIRGNWEMKQPLLCPINNSYYNVFCIRKT